MNKSSETLTRGQRVRVTRGGHSDETGTIRDVRPNDWTGRTTFVVTLDTGTLWYDGGSRMEVVPA